MCLIWRTGQTKREPERPSGGTKGSSFQRGLLGSRTFDSFHRETQHKELSLAQNRVSSDLVYCGAWQSTLGKREHGAGTSVRSTSTHRYHHRPLKNYIKLPKNPPKPKESSCMAALSSAPEEFPEMSPQSLPPQPKPSASCPTPACQGSQAPGVCVWRPGKTSCLWFFPQGSGERALQRNPRCPLLRSPLGPLD